MGAKVRPDGETREKVRVLDVQGLSRNEISAALGISTQAVHYHLTRLRQDSRDHRGNAA